MLFARLISIQDYGQFVFGNSMAKIAAAIAMMGCLGLMVKSWGRSGLTGFERKQYIYHISNWYLYRGLPITIAISLIWFFYSKFINHSDSITIELVAFLYVIPLFVANLNQSYFISIKKPLTAGTILLIMNGFWVIFLIWCHFFNDFSSERLLISLLIGSLLLATTINFINSKRYGITNVRPQNGSFNFALAQWGSMLLAQIDIILLQFFSDSEQLAFYGVALQLSLLVAFVLGAIVTNVVSQLAEDYNILTKNILQQRVRYYVKIISVFSLIVLIFLYAVGYYICLLFGSAYGASYSILCILLIGQSFNAISGCNGWLLNIAGYEKITAQGFYIAICIKLILGIIFLNYYGVYGVAIASVIALVVWNLIMIYFCYKKLGINPTIITYNFK
jgi:O-antigen/teichoic acid export membrane protein